MRKARTFRPLLLAVLLSCVIAIPACAKGINVQSLPSDIENYIKIQTFVATHPQAGKEIDLQLNEGNTEALEKYIPDPEEQEFYLKMSNGTTTIADVLKTALITTNPQNEEKGVIPSVRVEASNPAAISGNRSIMLSKPEISVLSTHYYTGNKITLDIFGLYKNRNNELVVLGIIRNNSGKDIEISGFSSLELAINDRKFAGGEPTKFKTPLKYSPYKAEWSTGVYHGLPTASFVKIIFEPGTYDANIDVSNLDNVSTTYILDYQEVK